MEQLSLFTKRAETEKPWIDVYDTIENVFVDAGQVQRAKAWGKNKALLETVSLETPESLQTVHWGNWYNHLRKALCVGTKKEKPVNFDGEHIDAEDFIFMIEKAKELYS